MCIQCKKPATLKCTYSGKVSWTENFCDQCAKEVFNKVKPNLVIGAAMWVNEPIAKGENNA